MFLEENFPDVGSSEELDELKAAHQNLDEIYVASGSQPERRELIEELWTDFEAYADKGFRERAKQPWVFNKAMWELYLGATLIRRGYDLVPRTQRPSAGPDFQIKSEEGLSIWIEATTPERGEVDPVLPPQEIPPGGLVAGGGDIEGEHRPKILRITQAVKEKLEHYRRSRAKNIIKSGEPYIVAISGTDIEGDMAMPDFLLRRVFFGAGVRSYTITPGGKLGDPHVIHSPTVNKHRPGGAGIESIDCGLFCGEEYGDISAVIFTMNHIVNCHIDPEQIGNDLIFSRNPHARNPLPEGFWKIGREWTLEGDKLRFINHDWEGEKTPY